MFSQYIESYFELLFMALRKLPKNGGNCSKNKKYTFSIMNNFFKLSSFLITNLLKAIVYPRCKKRFVY